MSLTGFLSLSGLLPDDNPDRERNPVREIIHQSNLERIVVFCDRLTCTCEQPCPQNTDKAVGMYGVAGGYNLMNTEKRVLQVNNITKEFPGMLALDQVSFDLYEGEVHALVGENGAGKSTLMKILSGAYTPTSGEIELGGNRYNGFYAKAIGGTGD